MEQNAENPDVDLSKLFEEIEMNAIYQFELNSLELLDVGSSESADAEVE